jgi:hypothetical protein
MITILFSFDFFGIFQKVPLTSSSGLFFFFWVFLGGQNGEFVPPKKSLIYPCQKI